MRYLMNFAERYAKGKYILLGFVLIVVFNVLLGVVPRFWGGDSDAFSATSVPDLWYSYTPFELRAAVKVWTPAMRSAYVWSALLVDNLYALVYSLTYMLVGWWIYSWAFPNRSWWKLIAICLPFVVGVMDWIENFSLSRVVSVYPESSLGGVLASWVTWLKWNGAVLLFVFFVVGLVLGLVWREKGRGGLL